MATWDITVTAQINIGSGTDVVLDNLTGGNAPPGDFDGSDITDVSVVGSPTIATGNGPTDDTIGVRFFITTDANVNVLGGDTTNLVSLCNATLGDSASSDTITDGANQFPSPVDASPAVANDWDDLRYSINYTANMMGDNETMDWSSFTIRVTYTPVGGSVTRAPGVGSLALNGLIPVTVVNVFISPPVGSTALTGQIPTLQFGFNIAIPVGSLILTGYAPTVERSWVVEPGGGTLTITGLLPDAIREDNHIRGPPVGSLVLTGQEPTLKISISSLPDVGTLALTGYAPSVEISHVAEPPVGSLTLTGYAPLVESPVIAQPPAGALTLTGYAPTVERSWVVEPPAGSLILTGYAPSVEISHVAQPPAGSLILTGYAPTVERSWVVEPPAGSLTLTGYAPTVERSWTVEPPVGSLTLTGYAPLLSLGTPLPIPVGSLTLTGIAPTYISGTRHLGPHGLVTRYTYTPKQLSGATYKFPPAGSLTLTGYAPVAQAGNNHVAQPPAGSLTLTGYVPTVERSWVVEPPAGLLTLTGYVPTVERSWVVEPPVGSLTLTGEQPAVLTGDTHVAQPPVGSLTLTGYAPTVERSWVVEPPVGSLTLTGYAPTVERSWVVEPPVGSLTLTGYALTVERSWVVEPPVGSLIFTGYAPVAQVGDNHTAQPGSGSLTLTGYAPTVQLTADTVIPVPVGALALTAYVPTIAGNTLGRKLGPHGFVATYPIKTLEPDVQLAGAQIDAEAGNVNVDALTDIRQQFGPHGLTSKVRDFDPKALNDVSVPIIGAEIASQWGYPDSANATIYPDGEDADADAGSVSEGDAAPNGAEIAGEAGTVTSEVINTSSPSGAAIAAAAGEVTAVENGAGYTITMGTITGEAAALTVQEGLSVSITGAQIDGAAATPGVDVNDDVSPTVLPATIVGEAGTVVAEVNDVPGAVVLAEAGTVTATATYDPGTLFQHKSIVPAENRVTYIPPAEEEEEVLAVVDMFNRPDTTNDLGPDWVRTYAPSHLTLGYLPVPSIEGNRATSTPYIWPGDGNTYHTGYADHVEELPADQFAELEIYEFENIPGGSFINGARLHVRTANPNTDFVSYYDLSLNHTDTYFWVGIYWRFYGSGLGPSGRGWDLIANGPAVYDTNGVYPEGMKLRFEAQGNLLTGYYDIGAGWVQTIQGTDSTIPTGEHAGFVVSTGDPSLGERITIDNFRAGVFPEATITLPTTMVPYDWPSKQLVQTPTEALTVPRHYPTPILYTDDFNRPGPELGHPWDDEPYPYYEFIPSLKIGNNQLIPPDPQTAFAYSYYDVNLSADYFAEIELYQVDSNIQYWEFGLALRVTNALPRAEYFFGLWGDGGAQPHELGLYFGTNLKGVDDWIWEAGPYPLPFNSSAVADGAIFRVEARGDRLSAFLNGELIYSKIDTEIDGLTEDNGVTVYISSNEATISSDNFRAGNLSSA